MIKRLLFAGALAFTFNSISAQTVIFQDSFETYTDFAVSGIGQWTMKDLDGKRSYGIQNVTFPNGGSTLKAFQVFNKTKTTPALVPDQFGARTGDKQLICWNISEAPLQNNDWAISPKIKLGVSNNVVSFWIKPGHEDYGQEEFNVWVSTTGTEIADFVKLNDEAIMTEPILEWVEYTFDLDQFKGKDVYIGIQCVSKDQFALQLDDFKVVGNIEVQSVSDIKNKSISVYPNPTTDYLKFNQKVDSAQIFDMTGKLVASPVIEDSKINVKSLQNGTYVLKMNTESGSTSHKFIKK